MARPTPMPYGAVFELLCPGGTGSLAKLAFYDHYARSHRYALVIHKARFHVRRAWHNHFIRYANSSACGFSDFTQRVGLNRSAPYAVLHPCRA
jgi:hypothetical protein